MIKALKCEAGRPTPLGTDIRQGGVNFALFSDHAERVTVCLFSKDGITETDQIDLKKGKDGVWHGFAKGLTSGQLYGYRVDGPYRPHEGHRFNANKLLIDPYAKELFGAFIQHDALFGYDVNSPEKDLSFDSCDSAPYMPKCVIGSPKFEWDGDVKPRTKWADTIIYEAHIKGLSKLHPDIDPTLRGTLSALSDKALIHHLKTLGVTAVELLPAQSFFSEPRLTDAGLTNYWGYNPVNYFALHNAYLGPNGKTAFQSAVKALHEAGIEVILDVVYNHTAESWELGPTLSYRGIDNKSYYRLQDDLRFYVNDTGCGNTFNITHPRARDLAITSLRYWAEEMRVDGFRFDLASTLGRNPIEYDKDNKFFNTLQSDPILRDCKLIAEPWDIGGGGYVLGGFPKGWTEWNDKFRDDVRSFWRGDGGAHRALASRLLGSAEQFDHSQKPALSSINFITSHDGFTLRDTVSYIHKHNLANLEDNRDGHGHNLSDNMGVEGATDDTDILATRTRRSKNMLATLLLSQGVPMLLAGDEFGHSQKGNNNAYCQDNETTWLNWDHADKDLQAFTSDVIALRKSYPHFSQDSFLHGEPINSIGVKSIEWVSPSGHALSDDEWNSDQLDSFGILLSLKDQNSLMVIFNTGRACKFEAISSEWNCLLTSGNTPVKDGHIPEHSVSVLEYEGIFISPKLNTDSIQKRAISIGIEQSFRDITGHVHTTEPETNLALLKSMSALSDNFKTQTQKTNSDASTPHVHANGGDVYGADVLNNKGKVWGVTCALYGLRSERNQGIGDFEDLAQLCEIMAKKGADFIGINPVHALFPSAPHLYAPYSASSRAFFNVMHIAIDKMPYAALSTIESAAIRKTEFVDYDQVYAVKHTAFEAAYSTFKANPKNDTHRKSFEAFKKTRGVALHSHALFDAIFETLPAEMQTYEGWHNFAKPLQDAKNASCREFAKTHSDRIEYYIFLQWVADTQFRDVQKRAITAGMSIGLYIDFAVGVVPGGSDAWRHKDSFAGDVSLGAPGDMANPDGQKWNLLPLDPQKLEQDKAETYTSALRHTMSVGGAVRIDHILGLSRAFWIPRSGGTGAYVKYPFIDLVSLIADISHTEKCIVFGEDLGTVPDGFRDKMADHQLMGCNVMLFERDSHGQIEAPHAMRALTMAAFSNHDFPTLSGFWAGSDFAWREDLDIGNDPEQLTYERIRRQEDKAVLAKMAGIDGAEHGEMNVDLMAGLMGMLSSSSALAVSVQLDDLMLEPLQANVPGTTDEQPNWKRKSRLTVEEIATDPDVSTILKTIHDARA
mgnify:CR=1 FL=1